MKTYFYAARSYKCNGECRYQTCTKRCLHTLRKMGAMEDVVVLPGGSHLKTPGSMSLRSGDLVILYAGNRSELEELIAIREIFEPFRIVLIVGENGLVRYEHFHLLNPRFTTAIGENLPELAGVINRITSAKC